MRPETNPYFYFEKISGELTEAQIVVERAEARQAAQVAIIGLERLRAADILPSDGARRFVDRLIAEQAAIVGDEIPAATTKSAVLSFNPDPTTT